MTSAKGFVEAAREHGFTLYAGVPCSFLTPFINYVISDPSLRYLSCANEGDAVAVAAGWTLAGRRAIVMMQNSGLGNAVSPLTSLTWTFRLPQLLIVTWRGEPGITDEPQHQLMGPITPSLLEAMEIAWEFFPQSDAELAGALQRATAHMERVGRPYALLMRKGTVSEYALQGTGAPPPRPAGTALPQTQQTDASLTRTEVLRDLIARTELDRSVLIATTGFTGRELWALDDRPNQLYMVGSMGCAPGVGLGLALAQPGRRVIVIDGDGAALMRLSLFSTLGAYGPRNLIHLLLDNHAHDSTGAQATVSRGISFSAIAAACGYPLALEGDRLDLLDRLLAPQPLAAEGPRFARLYIRPGAPAKLPRPTVTPEQVAQRLTAHLHATEVSV